MKKYRTKSGTVEEKLPGVNATVNPSEKTQIAMAGGANTLKDVQTILGQEGKRNNLKGQGAKHLVSFYMGYGGGDVDSGESDIGGEGLSGGENYGGLGFGGYEGMDPEGADDTIGQQVGPEAGYSFSDVLGMGDPGRGAGTINGKSAAGWGIGGPQGGESLFADDPEEEVKAKPSRFDTSRFKAPPKTEVVTKLGGPPKMSPSKGYTPPGKGFNLNDLVPSRSTQLQLGLAKGVVDLGMAKTGVGALLGVGGIVGALALHAFTEPLDPALHGGKEYFETDEEFEAREAGLEKAAETKAAYQTQPTKMDPKTPWAPPDEPDPEGAPKKKKFIRSAANNTTLAIAEKDDLTRAQIRRARRQITRFA
jgi:hypothetical protein